MYAESTTLFSFQVANLGVVVVPKSVTASRIKENIEILDFALDPEDVAYLDSCNKNIRVSPLSAYKDHKYYSFNAEF